MQAGQFQIPLRPKLSEKDFGRISTYIHSNFGIRLPLSKLILVESRLIKRILKLNIQNFSDYVSYVFSTDGAIEQLELIDLISTNKTDFFREDHHFTFLSKHLLTSSVTRPINIWSAACSSGEEPFTVAMVLEELRSQGFNGSYSILATDISSAILNKAKQGRYALDRLSFVPKHLQKKYFSIQADHASVHEGLSKAIVFEKFNLVDESAYSRVTKKFEFIFCRNVLIYFDQATQTKVVANLISKLAPGGVLFLGHSETLLGRNLNLRQLEPTIYQKPHA
jgi:chemotaxis protein methyltransferase CheR